jgi:4-hydroxy-tetrahydrodipicolinate reductase
MDTINVMINGLPGNVTRTITAHALKDDRVMVMPYSLTGPEIEANRHTVDGTDFELIKPASRTARIGELIDQYSHFISVDFTHPSAVNDNAEFYCQNQLPFVMGTTGGDRNKLNQTVNRSSTCAVIAPNMAKQIVGFQAMLDYAATTFSNLFNGYALTVNESHQSGKADTSGTARAVVDCFNRMGVAFSADEIQMERDPEIQTKKWGIPETYLSGHGWHTYRLTSPDQTVVFEFKHNVNGRDIYAGGTLDAVLFLNQKLKAGERGKVFSMIDVLKG